MAMSRLAVLVTIVALAACGRVTGIDDYELVDCPSGTCADASGDGAGNGTSDGGAAASKDAASSETSPSPPACPPGQALLTVVNHSDDHIVSEPPGIDVAGNQTDTACFPPGTGLRLETTTDVSWSGVQCKDGSRNSRCEFSLPVSGDVVTVSN